MKNLKSLIVVFVLAFTMTGVALADGPTCNPGEILTPPCTSAPVTSEDPAPGETPTPPASDSVDVVSLVEFAFESLLLF